jgi:hypothetical protein
VVVVVVEYCLEPVVPKEQAAAQEGVVHMVIIQMMGTSIQVAVVVLVLLQEELGLALVQVVVAVGGLPVVPKLVQTHISDIILFIHLGLVERQLI